MLILIVTVGLAVGIYALVRYLTRPKYTIFGIDFSKKSAGMHSSTKRLQTTPKGVTVYSENGLTDFQLKQIDEAAEEEFARAAFESRNTYTRALEHSFYDIFIPVNQCGPAPESGVPAFLIRADNYDGLCDAAGNTFDQWNPQGKCVADGIGVVFAAEMVHSLGTPGSTVQRGQFFVCEGSAFKESVRNGIQHIILANNNTITFERTATHQEGGHPLPYPPVEVSLSGERGEYPTGQLIVPVR